MLTLACFCISVERGCSPGATICWCCAQIGLLYTRVVAVVIEVPTLISAMFSTVFGDSLTRLSHEDISRVGKTAVLIAEQAAPLV